MLEAYVGKRQSDWEKRLGMVESACNNAMQSLTRFTSLYLCYGWHPVNLANLLIQIETKNEVANEFIEQLYKDMDQAIQNLRNA